MNSFAFERDFANSLRCIPMSVRFKLDRCGVKLSLRQWSRLTLVDRQWLMTCSCEDDEEAVAMRGRLTGMIQRIPGEAVTLLEVEIAPIWASRAVPAVIAHQCYAFGIAPPTRAQWSGLAELQRFALVKLTRDGHENANFLPAMIEFGLLGIHAVPAA